MEIAIEIGDRGGEGKAYGNLGNSYQGLGDYQKAIDCCEKLVKIPLTMDIAVDGTEGKRFAVYAAIMSSCRQWSFVVSLIYLCVLDVSKLREKACVTTR